MDDNDPTLLTRRNFTTTVLGATLAGVSLSATSETATSGHSIANSESDAAMEITAEDKLKIIELMAIYAWCYDTSDIQGFAATFVPDGIIEVFGKEMARGREAMGPFLQQGFEMRGEHGWQHLTDHHVFRDYDRHNCTVYSYYLMPESDANGANVHLRAMGYYVSHCTRSGRQWLFKKRSVYRWDGKKPW